MKLGITGSASYLDYERFRQVVQAIPVPVTLIVTGGQQGTEQLARRYAREMGLPCLVHNAPKTPGTLTWLSKRNALLANDSDNLLVFAFSGTRTLNMIGSAAQRAGKRCNVVHLDPEDVTLRKAHGNPQNPEAGQAEAA